MSTYSTNQEIKDLLWGTPMPIAARINGEMIMIHLKGSCSLIVNDADLLQEKLPDLKAMASQVRSTLVLAATDAVAEMSRTIPNFEQIKKLNPEFSMLLKTKAMDQLSGFGLKLKDLDIHSIERA